MALQPRRRCYLDYGEPGPVWHERLVLAAVDGSDYVVATPDMDLFVEMLSLQNEDLTGFRVGGVDGIALPAGLDQGLVYAFDVLAPGRSRRSSPRG